MIGNGNMVVLLIAVQNMATEVGDALIVLFRLLLFSSQPGPAVWDEVYGFDMSVIKEIALTEPLVDIVEGKVRTYFVFWVDRCSWRWADVS